INIFVFRELLGEFRLQHPSYRLVSAFVVLLLDQKIYSLQHLVVQPYRHYAQRDSICKLHTIYIRLSPPYPPPSQSTLSNREVALCPSWQPSLPTDEPESSGQT